VDKADGARADAATISSTFLFSCEWVTDVLRDGEERRGMVHGYGCMVRGRCDEPRDVERGICCCTMGIFFFNTGRKTRLVFARVLRT
jgi:hypothetical protein